MDISTLTDSTIHESLRPAYETSERDAQRIIEDQDDISHTSDVQGTAAHPQHPSSQQKKPQSEQHVQQQVPKQQYSEPQPQPDQAASRAQALGPWWLAKPSQRQKLGQLPKTAEEKKAERKDQRIAKKQLLKMQRYLYKVAAANAGLIAVPTEAIKQPQVPQAVITKAEQIQRDGFDDDADFRKACKVQVAHVSVEKEGSHPRFSSLWETSQLPPKLLT